MIPADLGTRGEQAAARWYEEAGYRVVARNWRCRIGEIDLILVAPDATCAVFCEVKTRTTDRYGSPAEAVTSAKQRRLRRLAARWLAEGRPSTLAHPEALRFDVACVTPSRALDGKPGAGLAVEVIEAAF